MKAFCVDLLLIMKIFEFCKKGVLKPVRYTGSPGLNCKSVIILLFINQFQQFKNLSNFINWKLSV